MKGTKGFAGDAVPDISDAPHIILIAVDTLRCDHLGCYGYARATSPHIDQFASEGVLFENCYSPASWTFPAFMSIFTGLMPAVHQCINADQDVLRPSISTLAEQLQEQGYYCAAVVCNPCINGKYGFSRGFDIYDEYSVFLSAGVEGFGDVLDKKERINNIVSGNYVTSCAIESLTQLQKKDRPFFFFVLYLDPHENYLPWDKYNPFSDPTYSGSMDGRSIREIRGSPPNKKDLQHLIDLYDGEISFIDHQIGKLIRHIDSMATSRETLIIFISDHGEAFGEHGKLLHGNSAYREELHVPMIWRWPGKLPPGRRVKATVSTLDIRPTLEALLKIQRKQPGQGLSLWPELADEQPHPSQRLIFGQKAHGSSSDLHFAITQNNNRFHIYFNTGDNSRYRYEYYALSNDAGEQNNLYGDSFPCEDFKQNFQHFWQACSELQARFRTNKPSPPVELSPEELRNLKCLGYVGP